MFTIEPLIAAEAATNILSGLGPDQRFVLTIIGIGCATLLLLVLGGVFLGVWSSAKEKQIEADLKRDMLDRGMSAEDVAQVIEAARPESFVDRWAAGQGKRKTG